jgi:hypothetical protein
VNGLAVCTTVSNGGSEITALSKAVVDGNSSRQQPRVKKKCQPLDALFTIEPSNVLHDHVVQPLL